MGPTEIGRPQGPQSIPRAVLVVVHALFPEAPGRCGCSTQSGAPAAQEGLSGFEDFQSFPGNCPVGVPPSLKQGIGVGDWGEFSGPSTTGSLGFPGLRDPGVGSRAGAGHLGS